MINAAPMEEVEVVEELTHIHRLRAPYAHMRAHTCARIRPESGKPPLPPLPPPAPWPPNCIDFIEWVLIVFLFPTKNPTTSKCSQHP